MEDFILSLMLLAVIAVMAAFLVRYREEIVDFLQGVGKGHKDDQLNKLGEEVIEARRKYRKRRRRLEVERYIKEYQDELADLDKESET